MADEITPLATGDEPEPTPTPESSPPPEPAPADEGELGDAGKRALDAIRAEKKAAEQRAKTLEAELEELRTAQLSDQEKALKEAADGARAEARQEFTERLFATGLRSAARADITLTDEEGKPVTVRLVDPELLANPEVAVRLLGLDEIPVTETGDIDTEAISAALTSFVKAKPSRASATQPGESTPAPLLDLGQGSRGPVQTATVDQQIAEAEQANDWDRAGALKMQKLVAATQQP